MNPRSETYWSFEGNIEALRRVVNSADGKTVLRGILFDLRYFDQCEDADSIARRNYANELVSRIAGNQKEIMGEYILEAVQRMAKHPLKYEEEDAR